MNGSHYLAPYKLIGNLPDVYVGRHVVETYHETYVCRSLADVKGPSSQEIQSPAIPGRFKHARLCYQCHLMLILYEKHLLPSCSSCMRQLSGLTLASVKRMLKFTV